MIDVSNVGGQVYHIRMTRQPPSCYARAVVAAQGLDPEDEVLWHALTAMRASVDRALEQRLQHDAGVSVADYEVLRGLAAAEGQRLRAGALAEALGWEKSRISHQVRRMSERGLLERSSCSSDGRGTWVELADAGAAAYAAATCGYAETLRTALFERLGTVDRTALRRVVDAVIGEPLTLV